MRLPRVALAVLLAGALAGCAAPETLQIGRGPAAPDPFYREHRAQVQGEHDERYPLDVDPGATLLNITLLLDARTNGLPLPDTPLARLTLDLHDPSGTLVQSIDVVPDRPTAILRHADPMPGTYDVRIRGIGFSQALDGKDYGAAYLLALEIQYA